MENIIFFQGIQYGGALVTIHFDGVVDGKLVRGDSRATKRIAIDFEKGVLVTKEETFKIIKGFKEFNELATSLGFYDTYCDGLI